MDTLQKYNDKPTKKLRDKIIEQLKHNYTQDNLEIDDFEKRLETANHTQSTTELMALVKGLPENPELEKKQPEVTTTYNVNKGNISRSMPIVAIFSGVNKRGLWNPAQSIPTISIFGGVNIDLREARLNPGITNIKVVAIFGGVNITVPEGVNVEVHGIGIFGGFSDRTTGEYDPQAPTIRISGVSFFGGVDVKIKRK
ncbi:MAG: hypothetical protein JW969_15210 [Spirochaetales bacterium]|nr:hypothetical protein [Spirochaetales bacterium]